MIMKYTKRVSALFCAVMLILCTTVCVFAQASGVITDNAELFTESEKAELQSQLDALSEKTGWMAVIYTNYDGYSSDEIKPHSNRYYADNYGKTTAGVMLTIDMEGRAVDFRTKGDAMYYFSDNRVDTILDGVQSCLKEGLYYDAAAYFISYSSQYYDAGIPEGESNENIDIQEKEDNALLYVLRHYGIIFGVIALAVATIVVFVISRKYKNSGKEGTYDLRSNSVTNLTERQDIFLTKHVSVTTESSSSSDGGSSGGSSSGGGGSSGGGSRSF